MSETHVLEMRDIEELYGLEPYAYQTRDMTPEEFRHIGELCDAIWLHSGDPARPHAELTSGKCSDGFVDVLRILRFTSLCDILGLMLFRKFSRLYGQLSEGIDWVVGSDHAGATLSFSVARCLRAQHDFSEKGPNKEQLWKRFVIQPEATVLQVEELVTTTGTLQAVRDGIRVAHSYPIKFMPVVLTLVHRSDVYEFEKSPILFFVHYDIKTWEPSECPLCKAGSKRLRPKQNWRELTGKA